MKYAVIKLTGSIKQYMFISSSLIKAVQYAEVRNKANSLKLNPNSSYRIERL